MLYISNGCVCVCVCVCVCTTHTEKTHMIYMQLKSLRQKEARDWEVKHTAEKSLILNEIRGLRRRGGGGEGGGSRGGGRRGWGERERGGGGGEGPSPRRAFMKREQNYSTAATHLVSFPNISLYVYVYNNNNNMKCSVCVCVCVCV
jgi:hypothetical protein